VSRFSKSRRCRAGFTLIESFMAMGILGISIAAFMDGAYLATSVKTDVVSVTRATMVARAVMAEIEQKLIRDGFGAFEKSEGCDFRVEGLKNFHCDYSVKKVELPIGDMIQRLMTGGGAGAAGGIGQALAAAGAGSSSGAGASGQSLTGALGPLGSLPGGLSGIASSLGGGGAGGLASLAGNALNLYAAQMQAMIEEALREVRLTLSWKVGRKTYDSMTVVTHLIEIGRAGVSGQDQLSGQISRQFGLQAGVPGQPGAPGAPPLGGGLTGTMPPFPAPIQSYIPGTPGAPK
jgi:hypothetical protein